MSNQCSAPNPWQAFCCPSAVFSFFLFLLLVVSRSCAAPRFRLQYNTLATQIWTSRGYDTANCVCTAMMKTITVIARRKAAAEHKVVGTTCPHLRLPVFLPKVSSHLQCGSHQIVTYSNTMHPRPAQVPLGLLSFELFSSPAPKWGQHHHPGVRGTACPVTAGSSSLNLQHGPVPITVYNTVQYSIFTLHFN